MDKERFLQSGLLEQYVLGLTTEEENAEVERYAALFPDVEEEIEMLRLAMRHYAEEQIAQLELKSDKKIYTPAVSDAAGMPPYTAPRNWTAWILAAGLFISAAMSFYFYQQHRHSRRQLVELRSDIKGLQKTYQQELQEVNTQLGFLLDNGTHYLHLHGTSLSPTSDVRVFWNENTKKAFLQVIYLPPVPQGKKYHIWAGLNGEMKHLALVHLSEHAPQPIPCLPEANSLNITLEPENAAVQAHEDQLFAWVEF